MQDRKEPSQKVWFRIPENFALMSDEEIRMFAESLWLEVNNKLKEDHEER